MTRSPIPDDLRREVAPVAWLLGAIAAAVVGCAVAAWVWW
jgi:hypothetical protein